MTQCYTCGQPLLSKRPNAKFCNTKCRVEELKKQYHLNKHNPKIKQKKMDKKCLYCGEKLINVLPHRKFCNKKCNTSFRSKSLGFEEFCQEKLQSHVIGAMNEMLVCADLIRKGYEVFKAICNNSCDIAILKNKILLRVEVTTGNIFKINGKIHIPVKNKEKFDILAIVLKDGKIIYQPEFKSQK